MASKRLEALQSEAEAEEELHELRTVVRDDVLNAETRGAIAAEGPFGTSPVKASNDADKFVHLYHAYDGRVLPLPAYQAEDRIKRHFDYTDEIPEEWRGKRVWYVRPQPANNIVNEFQCRLNRNASQDVLDEIKAAGLQPTCRKRVKNGGFATQFEADEHFRVKHPRRWAAYQRFLEQNSSKQAAASMDSAVKAMLAMAGANAAKE